MPKVLVTMDQNLLARVDKAAVGEGLSRSAYLEKVLVEILPQARTRAELRKRQRALDRLRELGAKHGTPGDATAFIRSERDSRADRMFGQVAEDYDDTSSP